MSSTYADHKGPVEEFFSALRSSTSLVGAWLFGSSDDEDHSPHPRTPEQSQHRMVRIGFLMSAPGFAFSFYLLRHFAIFDGMPLMMKAAISIAAYGLTLRKVLSSFPEVHVAVQYIGVVTRNHQPVDEELEQGDHPMYYNEGREPVYVGPIEDEFNPPAFIELAKDKVPVWVDAYFVGHIARRFHWLTKAGEGTKKIVRNEFISSIRLFVQNWERAEEMVSMRNLLAKFLSLKCDDAVSILKFKEEQLDPLTVGENPMLTREAVQKIIQEAGNFCAMAEKWGYEIDEINTEHVNLPQSILAAAEAKAATKDRLEIQNMRNQARIKMIGDLKKELPGLPDQDAMNSINMLLGLPVETKAIEVTVRNLEKIADSDTAKALAAVAKKYLKEK